MTRGTTIYGNLHIQTGTPTTTILVDLSLMRNVAFCRWHSRAIGGVRRGADEAQKSAWEEEEKRGHLAWCSIIFYSSMMLYGHEHGYPVSTIFRQT